jgi:hypothetical protein
MNEWEHPAEADTAFHAHPLVTPLPGSTAHPAAEAWPQNRFARLQGRLAGIEAAASSSRQRSVVVLPSRSVDRWYEPRAETRSYEERLLSFLFDLRDPGLELTFVTSARVAPRTIDYYLSLLPREQRLSARKRLRLVSLGDDSQRSLSEKLLERPSVLEKIRRTLSEPRLAYLLPYNTTVLEREIALALDIPVYGADPDHGWVGTKSGGRALFARSDVPHPLGVEHIRTRADAVTAIRVLRAAKPKLAQLVIKLDHGVSGEGNAVVDLCGLPAPGTQWEDELIARRLEGLIPEMDGVRSGAFLRKLGEQGGVVEERITGRELRSPSVQLRITPNGTVQLLSTHDQILHGRSAQQFGGCRFPADPSYASAISGLALRVTERLADIGVIGPLAIDFVVARHDDERWHPFALEVNLRMGGTTHPHQTLTALAGGSYEPQSGIFTTRWGQSRHYVATDHLEVPQLAARGRADLLARAARDDLLRFDRQRGRGTVFHMLSSVEPLATVGVTAIGDSPEGADALYADVRSILTHGAGARGPRARASRVRAALGTQS